YAQNASTPTSPATYTVQQLVTDVLVTSPCGIVSNITYSTGTNYGQQNGIGYFNKNGSSFGLDEGIILATRSADTCDGPNTAGSEGTTTWLGDAQLLSYMQSVGQSVTNYYNSSKLEFDFVPIADQVKFDFIFASDEYGTFQCDYSDAFAFFLTNTTTGVTTNLAVIPGSTPPIPVAVTTIRKNQYNSSCASANPTFFDKFYGTGNPQNGLPDVVDPINFNGYTIPMSAVGNVIPGQTYHMKFVVGDRNDASYDSAVFLSKFDIGNVNLGNDLTVSSNNALCVGQSYTINSGLTAPPYEFTWYFRDSSSSSFVAIAGQTGPTLSVTAPGEYKLVAHYVGSSCVGEDTVLVEFYPDLSLNTPEPNDLTICNSSPAFDLTQNTPIVLANFATPANYQVTYYLTQADAMAGTNAIANPASYVPVSNPQTIWVRIFNTNSSCYGVKEFDLSTIALPTADISYNSTPYCYNAGVANVVFTGVTGGNYSVVGTPANIFVDNTGTVTWNDQVLPGSYTIKYEIGTGTCSANDTFTIQIDAPINASVSGSTTICQGISTSVSFVGTPGAVVTYNDGNTNQTITLDAAGTASVNHVGGTKTYSLINVSQGSCIQSLTGAVVVSVVSIPQFTIPSNLTFCQNANNTLSVSPTNFNLSDVTYVWSFNTTTLPDVGSSIVVNQSGTYSVTVTNSQGCFATQTCVVNSIAMPTADIFTDVFVCDSYQLPALSSGNSYYTQPNAQGVQLFPGHLINSNQTVYVFAQTGTTPNCTDESSFDVTIVNSPQFTIVGGCEGSAFVVKAIIANPELYTFQWLDPSGAQVGTTSSVIANSPGIYTCNVTLTSGALSCVTSVPVTFDSVVCSIQKGISPNGDMKNDYLKLRAEKVEIFNRYGKEVYSK
ncbi:choice-of-anchor L domain-containing protein, partial [Flavobacterium sp.]|uniref:choice-of-anchor L domain-containing protein n=1 Tax=Flavobacterium sp. TaxID=239 RepID=UPI0035AF72AD